MIGLRRDLGGLAIPRPVDGPEYDVPEEDVVAVVAVGLVDLEGVMPAVKLGHAEDPVQEAKATREICVLIDAVNSRKDPDESNDSTVGTKNHEGDQLAGSDGKNVDRVKSQSVEPIESVRAVVWGVDGP